MNKFNLDWQKENLLKTLIAVVEHDEYLIEMKVYRPFIELEHARDLISKIERCNDVDSRNIAEPST